MPSYGVFIHARGCLVRFASPWYLLWVRARTELNACYTTRVVEADSPEAASAAARALLDGQLRSICLNDPGQPWTLEVERVELLEEAFDGPQPGLAWYAEGSDDDDDGPVVIRRVN